MTGPQAGWMVKAEATSFYAPGHNSLVEGPNGETIALPREARRRALGERRPMYAPNTFGDDGSLRFVDPPSTTPPNTKLCLEPSL